MEPDVERHAWASEDWYLMERQSAKRRIHQNAIEIGDSKCVVKYLPDRRISRQFIRKDGSIFEDEMQSGDLVCEAWAFEEFLAYQFIRYLRLAGGSAREYLLQNPEDYLALETLLSSFMCDLNLELHVPTELNLDRIPGVEFFTAQQVQETAFNLTRWIQSGKGEDVQKLLEGSANLLYVTNLFLCSRELPSHHFAEFAILEGVPSTLEWIIGENFFKAPLLDFVLCQKDSKAMQVLQAAIETRWQKDQETAIEMLKTLVGRKVFDEKVQEAFPGIKQLCIQAGAVKEAATDPQRSVKVVDAAAAQKSSTEVEI